jgi:hypothetical protein
VTGVLLEQISDTRAPSYRGFGGRMTTLRRLERLRPFAVLFAALGFASVAIRAQQPPTVPDPADWQAAVAKQIAQSEYHFSVRADAAVSAPNRSQDLRSTITPAGLELTARVEGESRFKLTLNLLGYGRGARMATAGAGTLVQDDKGASIARTAIREWYVNDERGLEQGFTLASRPEGSNGKAALELALGGNVLAYPDPTGQSILFKNAKGEAMLRYAELHVADAAGRELAAWMVVRPGVVRIEFDDALAVYPVTVDPLATSPAWTAESDQAGAEFGVSVATAGDVNGDGYADVIVGAPNYDGAQFGGGQVFVYLGSASGLGTSPAWTASGAHTNAQLGYSAAAAGDVNGDGYADVIVGAPTDTNGQSQEGSAFVYLGSAAGLAASPAWSAESDQAGANFGWSVATAGDVNGDGYADVIVGAFLYNTDQVSAGRAFVYLGSAAGPSTSPAWTVESHQEDAELGTSVASAGDVNGDGYSDVIVGEPNFANGQTYEGRAYIYLGSPAGLAATPVWTAEGNQQNAFFGTSVATAGDVNGDGFADVIVGAPQYSNGQAFEGRAFVYDGSASGPAASPAWTAESDQGAALFGYPVATAGDVNGDGYADVIVGAIFYDNGQTDEGRTFVYLGSAAGLSASPAWTAESDQANAQFGYSAATAGDVNGDGYSDVIVGARFYDNGQTDEGRAFVYYGSASGPATGAAWTAESDQTGALLGFAVATAGDVNGDGYSDVIVGAPDFDNGETDEGRAFVYHGSAAGLATIPAWTADGSLANANFGVSVATAGDVNGDGYADVIVGAPSYNDGGAATGGRAFVYHGSAAGLATSPAWTAQTNLGNFNFGWSVSTAGDVNGDGYADVIVGASSYENGQTDEGKAFVYLGSSSGLATNAAWSAEGDQDGAEFGYSVATAGDVNGDGYSDVIVGAHFYSNPESLEGRAFVYHGSASGLATSAAWTAESDQAAAQFGQQVATAGDVNGDGYSDVIVGAPAYDNGQTNEGRAFVYHGSASGLATSPAWTAESDQANARFGYSVATAGDVNGDGYADVIVGARSYDNGQTDEGRAFAYLGSATGLSPTPVWTAESDQAGASFGYSVATAGDVNGDGYSDVVVGASLYDNGESDEGRAFVYYGNGGAGLSRVPRQLRADRSAPIAPLGNSDSDGGFRLAAIGSSPAGRDHVRLEWQAMPLGTPFGTTGIQRGAPLDTAAPSLGAGSAQPLDGLVTGLTPSTPYKWRCRLASSNPFFPRSPWFSIPGNAPTETDVRTVEASEPLVVAVSPPTDQLGVAPATDVTVTFSESVSTATVTSAAFRLLDPQGTPVPAASPIASPSGVQFTLHPNVPLTADTLYTVQVTSAVSDLAGTAAQPFTSHFRTGSSSGSSGITAVAGQTSPLPTEAKGGSAVAGLGDVDADGIQDFISGAPGYTDQAHGVPVEAGAALIYLGSRDPAESAEPDVIFTGASAHDRVGVAVAGDFDFNGDGLRDIVIGAEQVDRATNPGSPAPTGAGKVYLIFFDPGDTVHYPNIGDPAVPDTISLALVGQPGGVPGVVFEGVALGDQAGFSVACGGTSKAGGGTDIVIGAPGADPGGRTDAGASYVVFDNPTLDGDVSLTKISDGLPDQVPGKAYLGAAAGDNLGYSTAFGGDVVQGQTVGTGSVLMGAPRASGARGVSVCPPGDPDTTPIIVDAVGTTRPGFRVTGTQDGEELGSALANGGDALADGAPDILIGSPTYDAGGNADAGRAIQLSQVMPSGVYAADAVGASVKGAVWTGEATGDQLGSAVAGVKDVTGDGYDDIALGAPLFDPQSGFTQLTDAGAVYLINGTAATGYLGTRSVAGVGTVIAGQRFTGTEAGEHAGSSIAGTGDIDDDGRNDFAVGAPESGSDSGTTYTVVDSNSPLPGNCGPGADCLVSDLNNGAQLHAPAGTLAGPVTLGVTGILAPGGLPGPVPAGKLFLGAAEFHPEGQAFLSPYATIHVPTVAGLEVQLTNLESLPVAVWTGSSWAAAGFNGSVVANPQYALRKAVAAVAGAAHVYAVFLNDADGDGIRDERDDCPSVANPAQTDTDEDGIGDACECVNVNCDDANACTDDGCDPESGCVHANNAVGCDDGDPCTTGDICAGGSCSGTPGPGPGELQNTRFTSKSTYVWDTIPNSPRYDVVRGALASLPVGPGGGDETCFDDVLTAVLVDSTTPAPGTGFWYVARGENACGIGTFGYRSNGAERVTTTCP